MLSLFADDRHPMSLPLGSTMESPTLMLRSVVAIVPFRLRSGMGMFFSMFMVSLFLTWPNPVGAANEPSPLAGVGLWILRMSSIRLDICLSVSRLIADLSR